MRLELLPTPLRRRPVALSAVVLPFDDAPRGATASDAQRRPHSTTLRLRSFCCLVGLDIACILVSFAMMASARGQLTSETNWLAAVMLLLPFYLTVALYGRAYSTQVMADPFQAVAHAVRAFLLAMALMTLVAFYLKTSAAFPRLTIASGSALAILLLALCRYQFVRNIERIVGGDPYSVALIWEPGQPVPETSFSLTIAADAFLDPDRHDPLMYDRLAKALEGMHNVVVSCHPSRRLAWAAALKGANLQSEILMPELEPLAPLGTNVHGSITSLVVAHGPLSLIERAIKRSFDVAVGGVALLVLSPLVVLVAICIRLESRGPVLFMQNRIGRGNKVFRMLKFRSMVCEGADREGDRSTARDDDRITRVGRIIRKTSLDELPQLLNVLNGDMSIVGPRPHALGSRAADKLFWEVDTRYWHRHATKPGLTGLAQVRGYRGATLKEDDLRNRLQADLEYVDTWSIWRDMTIIVQTFQVLIHRNAF